MRVVGSDLEEEGCGVCVQELTESLDDLMAAISDSRVYSVNQTQEDIVVGGIQESQVICT